MSTPLAPQKQHVEPNAVYASTIVLGMGIDPDGKPVGMIQQMVLKGASVDQTGRWSVASGQGQLAGVRFGFDENGLPTKLPEDLQPLAADIAAAWSAIVNVIGKVNQIRKLV